MTRLVASALVCLSVAACATAPKEQQMTLGDITAKGARKLSSDEVRNLLSGSRMSGEAWRSGAQFTAMMAPNGTFEGATSRGRKFSGVWTVGADGQSCTNFRYDPLGAGSPCVFTYELDGRYYIADRDEPTSRIVERKFAR
jgi:hypothetical protein